MGEDVVAEDQVDRSALGDEATRELAAEELADRLDSLGARDRRGARRRLDADARDAAPRHELQQVAVVGSDLHAALQRAFKRSANQRH